MPTLSPKLELERCPYCAIDKPNLSQRHILDTNDHKSHNLRKWIIYVCSRCGGVVIASAEKLGGVVKAIYPFSPEINQDIPKPVRDYLGQAIDSLHSPAGAVMLAASAVDAMLKLKGYKKGSLYGRIDKAAKDHVITTEMAKWAHEVRLDANKPRHVDEQAPLPDEPAAKRATDFTQALAQFMFVLPARVKRGLDQKTETKDISEKNHKLINI